MRQKRLFISYSSSDEKLKAELETHLAVLKHQGVIETWDFRKLHPGTHWDDAIKAELGSADVIVLLVSADFLASGYCWHVEMMRALERHRRDECLVVPIIIREFDWQVTPLGDIQALPARGKPVTAWARRDSAWKTVATALRGALSAQQGNVTQPPPERDPDASSSNTGSRDSGLITYHQFYPKREMIEHLARAERHIDILQTWVSNWSAFWVAMQTALRFDDAGNPTSDVRIRVILIDPKSDLCRIRGEHSGVSATEAVDHTKLSVRRMREFKHQFKLENDRLEIRLSNELPTFAMFSTETGIYFNPYLRQHITYESPCFVFTPVAHGFATELNEHFNGLWDQLATKRRATRRAG